jgi:PKD-like domain/Secretion system C-terminal sorting domain
MRNFKFLLAIGLGLALCSQAGAQSVTTNVVGYVEKGADVNFAEIATYYKNHPEPVVRKKMFDEDGEEERPEQPEPDSKFVHMYPRDMRASNLRETPHVPLLPASPAPLDTFESGVSDLSSIPPDTHGAVDSTYAVTAINTEILIQNRTTHATVYSATLDHFWTSMLAGGPGSFDPRVHYDPYYKRWIMICDAYGELATSQIMIAVSATSNPTGTWHMYKLPVGTSTTWLDFPCMGYNRRWIAVSGNFFNTSSGSFTNDVVYVFDYIAMMAGGTMSYGTLTPGGSSFTICPALTYDTAENNMFCVENYNGGSGKLRLWKITGAIGAGLTLTSVGYPTTTNHWQGSAPSGGADFAPQVGSTNKLQTNDDRVNNCQMRNGNIWCAFTAFLPATGTVTRASSLWWEIDTTATPVQVGLIDDPSTAAGHNFYFFPSIAVNKNNDALIGFAHASSTIHPSCSYALHLNGDTAGTWRPVYTYRHGQATYYETFGGSQDRWGDYSATCVDPRNNVDFWTLQESSIVGSSPNWDTWWAYVQVCPPLATPTAAIAPTGPCQGSTVLYSVGAVSGATSYTWTVSGTGWSGTSTTDSINLTVGTGVATISVVANNTCGTSSVYSFTVTPTLIPSVPAVTTVTAACVGSPSASWSATSTGATGWSWTVAGTGWSGSSTSSTLSATVGTGVGTVICTAANSCGTAADTLDVTPAVPPTLDSGILLSATLCTGNTVTAYSTGYTGATSYNWIIVGTGWGTSAVTTGDSLVIMVGTGTGTIIVNSINGCGTGPADTASGLTPTVTPVASFTESAHITTTTTAVTVTYTGTAPGATTYTWDFGGGTGVPGIGAGPQTVTWSTVGTKTVTVTVDNGGCSATYTDTVLVTWPTGVTYAAPAATKCDIVPNPNEGSFNVVFGTAVSDDVTVTLSDMQGKVVYTNTFALKGATQIPVSAGNLPNGVYMAAISYGGSNVNKKVTIVR